MSRAQPSKPGAIDLRAPDSRAQRLRAPGFWGWTARLRTRRAARAALRAAAHRLYGDLVVSARAQGFFRELGVPDTPEGRFEMIGLHAALVLLRLKREGEAGQALGQALFDLMMADMDQSLRELGVGDLGVGRQVKRLAGQFYARLHALEAALGGSEASRTMGKGEAGCLAGASEASRLGPMLRANVWGGGPEPDAAQVSALADYLIRAARGLDRQSAGALLRGEATFPGLDG
jgi:cytochrome b pre-mRNA-processing protein 3